jgi:hypothetical protein
MTSRSCFKSLRFNASLAGSLAMLAPRLVRAENSISYKYETYTEADARVAVKTEGALIEQDLGTDMHVKVEGVIDAIAGATPSGMPFQPGNNKVDPVNDPAWTVVRDRRKAWNAEFSRQFPGVSLAFGFANSRESDYVSNGWSVNTVTDFNEKNTELLAGVAGTDDDVEEFYSTVPRVNLKKRTNDVLLGVIQLLDPHTSVTFNVTLGRAVGFLNDQHKIVPLIEVVDPGPPPVTLIGSTGENRPDQRNKVIFLAALNHAFPELHGAVETSYRFYHDTFGTTAHTLQFTWIQRFGEHLILQPDVRLYQQSAANFYYYDLAKSPIAPTVSFGEPGPLPNPKGPFYASDYRLSALRTSTYGLKAVWIVNSRLQFDTGIRQYDMRGRDGVTPQVAYPRAAILNIGMKFSS